MMETIKCCGGNGYPCSAVLVQFVLWTHGAWNSKTLTTDWIDSFPFSSEPCHQRGPEHSKSLNVSILRCVMMSTIATGTTTVTFLLLLLISGLTRCWPKGSLCAQEKTLFSVRAAKNWKPKTAGALAQFCCGQLLILAPAWALRPAFQGNLGLWRNP